jgi:hypothetical protein
MQNTIFTASTDMKLEEVQEIYARTSSENFDQN